MLVQYICLIMLRYLREQNMFQLKGCLFENLSKMVKLQLNPITILAALVCGGVLARLTLRYIEYLETKRAAANAMRQAKIEAEIREAEEKEMEGIILRVLSNEEESRRLQDQLMSQKMLTLYKNNGPIKEKVISFDAFIKEAYGRT